MVHHLFSIILLGLTPGRICLRHLLPRALLSARRATITPAIHFRFYMDISRHDSHMAHLALARRSVPA